MAEQEHEFEILEAQEMSIIEDSSVDGPARSYEVRIIAPGWGSAGYYSEKILQESAGLFRKGLPVYADHPKLSDLRDRLGVRSVRDQVGVIGSDARWDSDGKLGPGVYSSLDVFESDRQWLYERRNTCGLSMHANGKRVRGKVGDQSGYIVTGLKKANSVDVVTSPGAGGGFASILESVNQELNKEAEVAEESKVEDIKESDLANTATDEATSRGMISPEQSYSIFEYRRMEDERNALKKAVMRHELSQIVDNRLMEHRILDVTRRRLSATLPDMIANTNGCLKSIGNGDYEIVESEVNKVISEQVEFEKVYIDQVFNDQGNMVRGERIVESSRMAPVTSPQPAVNPNTIVNHRPGSSEHLASLFEAELGMDSDTALSVSRARNSLIRM